MFSPGICFFYRFGAVRALLSFPTRRSSDLHFTAGDLVTNAYTRFSARLTGHYVASVGIPKDYRRDRKSTRLNSSHVAISYAVFCLKKKNMHYSNAEDE